MTRRGKIMKKQILLLIPLMMLTGCKKDTSKLKIVCPTGAPAIAFYKENSNPNFETNGVPSNIVSMMNENSDKDLVVIDTVSGLKAIKNGAPYKLAASLTFGNFYIASTGKDDDEVIDKDDKIVLFGQNQTPDLLFHYLYGNEYNDAIEYVTNVQDAAKCLITGKNEVTTNTIDYVFIAQPVLTNALNKNKNAKKVVDIQEAYKNKSEGKSLIQASLFVRNKAKKDIVNEYLKGLKASVEEAINNPDVISETLKDKSVEEMTALYGVAPSLAVTALKDNNGLGLGYKKGKDIKSEIDSFISLFSLENTNEEIYY